MDDRLNKGVMTTNGMVTSSPVVKVDCNRTVCDEAGEVGGEVGGVLISRNAVVLRP